MLDINPMLMGTVFVVFIASLLLLNNWLFKPLVGFMDKREQSIRSDATDIRASEDETKETLKKAQEILEIAKKEASQIKERAHQDAKKLSHGMLEQKQKELEVEYVRFVAELQNERAELKNSLVSQTPLFKESLKAKISRI